jgi:hypothetical protein
MLYVSAIILGAVLHSQQLVPWWGMTVIMLLPAVYFWARGRLAARNADRHIGS